MTLQEAKAVADKAQWWRFSNRGDILMMDGHFTKQELEAFIVLFDAISSGAWTGRSWTDVFTGKL